jgi:hypothetical protein
MRFGFLSASSVIVIALLRIITSSVVQVASAPLALANDYNLNLTASTIIPSSASDFLDYYYSDNSQKQGTAATTRIVICVENSNKEFQFQGKNNRTCKWVAKRKTNQKCKKNTIRTQCPLTCKVEQCISPPIITEPPAIIICVENPNKKFQFQGKNNRTCKWVAKRKTNKKCKKNTIRTQCPLTCKVKQCINNNNNNTTQSPTVQPSIMPSNMIPSSAPDAVSDEETQIFQGKKGICMTLREEGRKGSYIENLPKIQALNPYWVYTWASKPADGVPTPPSDDGRRKIPASNNNVGGGSSSNIDFFPMLWGYYVNKIDTFLIEIQQQNQRVVFGFNEPDKNEQSNITVETAIAAWPQLEAAVAETEETDRTTILVSPSCADSLNGSWLEEFMIKVDEIDLRVDAIGVHNYGGINFNAFTTKMETIYEKYNRRPIIITEFSVADWDSTSVETNKFLSEDVLNFMKQVMDWMEEPSQDWILGYAWFSFDINDQYGTSSALFDSNNNNKLTPLGEYYSTFKNNNDIIASTFSR